MVPPGLSAVAHGRPTPWPAASQTPSTAAPAATPSRARCGRRIARRRVGQPLEASPRSSRPAARARDGCEGRGSRQASSASLSSRGRSGRIRRRGVARPPIARAVAAGVERAVRVFARPALVEDQGQRVDVGLGPDVDPSLGLLGRHVGEGADDVSGGGQRRAVGEARDAEIHQLRARGVALLGDEDVLRLDVAVDDRARVGVVERLAEIGADLADLAVAELCRRGCSWSSVSPSTSSVTSRALPSSSPIS